MRMRRRVLAFVASAACAAAVHAQELPQPGSVPVPDREIQVAAEAFTKDPATPTWVRPLAIPEATDDGATGPLVVLLSDNQVRLGERGAPTTNYARRALRINDALVLSTAGRVPLPFVPAYQRVVLHTLAVVRDGQTLDRLPGAQARFLQRETGLENNVYSGVVTASILVDDLRVGDTLVIAFSTVGDNPVFGATWGGIEGWDQALPTRHRRVVLDTRVSRRIAWKWHGDLSKTFPSPAESTRDGIRTLVFEEKGLAALAPEPSVPPGFSMARWLQFSEHASWNGVATWAAALFDDREPASAERAALVAAMRAKPTVEDRVVAALEFVQSQVRYFSVSLGTSSHRPTAPNTVLVRRYGDCKDKSLLLVALLKDMGIASVPVLVNRRGFDDWLPTPLAFDHVIVAVEVDGRSWFLDSTRLGQHGRLARMGQVHDGAQVLAAAPGTTALARIAAPDRDALTLDERRETMTVGRLDGDGELVVVQSQNGVAAETSRVVSRALPRDRIDAAVTAEMEKRYAGAKLAAPIEFADDPMENRFVATMRFTIPKPAQRTPGGWRVAFRPDNFGRIFIVAPDSKRRAPIVVRYPVNARYTFETIFPDEVSATLDPETVTQSNPWFAYTAERSFRGNRSIATATMKTGADRVAAADLPRLRDELARFERTFAAAVVVADGNVKKGGLLGVGRQDFAEALRARQEDLVQRVGPVIASGRLSGADLAQAHCERGVALSSLGRTAEAVADGDAAVAADPNVPRLLSCRAEIRMAAGDFAGAVDDASRAIVLGAEGARAYQQRGQARFHLGRWREAADDFAKARSIEPEARSAVYSDLWRAMAYRRGGTELPDDLRARAAAGADGAWPQPALAGLAGRLDPDALRARTAGKSADESAMHQTEADVYLGEHWLATGDAAKARDAFAASRAHGVIIYTEYVAAGLELAKMGDARK